MNKNLYISIGVAVVLIFGALFFSKNSFLYGVGAEYSSSDTSGLPDARPAETVELKNGDTYTLTAGFVKKEIGNQTYRMLAYNGSTPGPIIKVAQGAEVTINFKNDTDVETTVHSHGVRLDNAYDGVPDMTQKSVKPGETFTYKIKFPDAGMYWYHPHVREDYQQELGLYGNYFVEPNNAKYWNQVNREVPLFLDDILIENGQIPLSKTVADHTLMGRYGNVMLVNGESDYSLAVKKGEVIRFYLTNAANARPFNFAIQGSKIKLVGGDSGAYEKDQWVDTVILGPSERAEIEVLFDKAGSYELQNKTPSETDKLGVITVSGDSVTPSYSASFATLQAHEDVVKSIDPFRPYFDKALDKKLQLTVTMSGGPAQMQMNMGGGHMMPDGTMMGGSMMATSPDGIEWDDTNKLQGSMSNTDNVKWLITDEATGKQNMDINWTLKKDVPVKIRIENPSNSMHPMQHPIHFHGQRFLVLSRNGAQQTDLVWKDTVLIPAGQYVDILLDPSNPGTWMAHCHIAEHLGDGMMFTYRVE